MEALYRHFESPAVRMTDLLLTTRKSRRALHHNVGLLGLALALAAVAGPASVLAQQQDNPAVTAPLASTGDDPAAKSTTAGAAGETAAPSSARPKSGLIGAIQDWIEDASKQPSGDPLERAKQAIDDLGHKARRASDSAIRATQESAEKLSTLQVAGSVAGREVCDRAPNGAPDCVAAAARLCKTKGFQGGKSADFVSAEKCPAQVWISGRREAGACTTETFVTRAVCQ